MSSSALRCINFCILLILISETGTCAHFDDEDYFRVLSSGDGSLLNEHEHDSKDEGWYWEDREYSPDIEPSLASRKMTSVELLNDVNWEGSGESWVESIPNGIWRVVQASSSPISRKKNGHDPILTTDSTYRNGSGHFGLAIVNNEIKFAVLHSRLLRASNNSRCFSFSYFMHRSTARLQLLAGNKLLLQRDGEQGNVWQKAQVSIPMLFKDENLALRVSTNEEIGWITIPYVAVDDFKMAQGKCELIEYTCGRKVHNRIMGGMMADEAQFPWMIMMAIEATDEFGGEFTCGGSIISKKWILTAAHCVERIPRHEGSFQTKKMSLSFSEYDLEESAKGQYRVNPSRILIHPQRNKKYDRYDAALVEIPYEIIFTRSVNEVCLPTKSYRGKEAIVAGWGYDPRLGYEATVLQFVKQKIIPCQKNMNTDSEILCARGISKFQDACRGDSGGGLVTLDYKSRYTVAGVVSTGPICGDTASSVGFYVDVFKIMPWINNVLMQNPL